MASENLLVVGWGGGGGGGGKGDGIEISSGTSKFVFEELIYNTPETHTTNRTRYLSALNYEFLVQPTNGRKKLFLHCKMCHKMCHKRTKQSLESIFLQSY